MASPTANLTVRRLPPEDWHRIAAFEPFATGGLPSPEQWRIIIAEEGDQVVGFCCVFAAAHWEPWHIAPSHRRNPAVARGLIREGIKVLQAEGIEAAFAVVRDSQPEQQAIVERLGFTPAPGKLYTIAVDDLQEF